MIINALFFWLILMVLFYIVYSLGARNAAARLAAVEREAPPILRPDMMSELEFKLAPVLAITGRKEAGGIFQFEGRLRGKAEEMFPQIREAFRNDPLTPILLEGEGKEVRVMLLPGQKKPVEEKPKWWLHGLLFVATLATTTWAGALHAGVNLLQEPGRFTVGLSYSLGLLLILGAHELGHYFTARRHGIRVTPPFFIPIPFALGTFGAFIKIKSITPNRCALFDVAVAGPLAGLVFAVPALFFGLQASEVISGNSPMVANHAGISIGSSILLACLAKLSLGAAVTQGDHLILHPLAFAGWLGLIVTALNLLPIGQLDGGHMSHAMFGARHAHALSLVALVSLFLLALFVWPGLMMWAFIVFFIAGTRDAPTANDVTSVGLARKMLGYFTFLLLVLIVVPVPHALYEVIGLHSPYV